MQKNGYNITRSSNIAELCKGSTRVSESLCLGSIPSSAAKKARRVSVAGDLGELGHSIVLDFFAQDGIDLSQNYLDCGMLIYDRKAQDMHAGGSGCGCAASVLNGYILHHMRTKTWNRILFAPTGALLSPVSTCQGESIPSICHVLCLSNERSM